MAGVSRVVALVCVVVACLAVAGWARADGDPASDFLVYENVYLPYQRPSAGASASLARQVASAYGSGFRVKVAVIAARSDLGAIPSLFGKPGEYAAFLGQELSGLYVGPLLVVMPSGYGIYDGGRSVAAEQSALASVASPSSSEPDELVAAATRAVAAMLKAGALSSPDVLKPYVAVLGGAYVAGRLTIRFYSYDDSGRVSLTVTVADRGRPLFREAVRSAVSSYTKVQTRTLQVPRGRSLAGARLCVSAVDASGNRGGSSCRKIRG
jgi:hypothetical protein